ncbi:MAG: hypothetical protein GY798_07485 [Hyphomicrobiales bacterium]|nr:hypothetical protein [Hyphomicrobiales bacterium]
MAFQWTLLKDFTPTNQTITVPWLMALETFGDSSHLKIEATGSWTIADGLLPACAPDGLSGLGLPATQSVIEDCRFGALLGKLGGSSASHHSPADDATGLAAGEPFPVGAYCVTEIPGAVHGPLFIGFNTLARPINIAALTVTISGARP